ncbi:Fatty acid synthase [Halotydeus destructor]|nr:Fatty acid synthase [Halotydeus destructor]
MQSTEMKKVWLTCCNRDPSAIYGLAKTLRLEENGHRIRLLVDSSLTGRSGDIRDKKYADILQDDLVYNVCNAESHGFFTHQSLKTEDTKDTNYYLRIARPGDLSSFTWTQSSVQSCSGQELISVKFAALNFRDVMFASGKLSGDAVPFVNPLVVQDSLLGLEFAGISENGRRVMGVVPAKALANKIAVSKNPDDRLVLDVPDNWTLEEASTIPAVYMTVYYALFIRAQLRSGESVLIHSAAGGVGLAAINVCLARRCHLYLTVGTQEKRDFLLSEFPTLDPSAIFDSRSTVFEDDIQKATSGKGVDVILNSLANEKLSAGLRCLSHNGRFLELGKVDFMSNSVLDINSLGHNQSFHGILLDIFAVEGSVVSESVIRVRKQLLSMLQKDIDSGIIKPLPRTIYRQDRIEDAFRFMATGQHVGKVVIDMSSSGPEMGTVKQSTHFDCAKSYLIVGGLGGFGLELASWLVVKGAKNIVLNGRSGIRTPYQRYTLERLQQDGARVEVSVENCALLDGAKSVLDDCLKLGPLGGILNAAVVLKDALLSNLTATDFNDAMDPKSRVTENLDSLTSQCSTLDHFVCFSSLSTGRGNQGQANYNLANGAMEAICRRRRESGLPGLAVQWGVIGDVGLIADKSLNASQVASKGFSPQRIPSCLEVLDHLMARSDAVVTSYVSASPETIGAEGPTDIFKMVSSVMGIKDLATVDPTATLGKLGIDSLITVEIKQLIERSLNVSYSLKQVRDLTVSDLLSLASAKQSS